LGDGNKPVLRLLDLEHAKTAGDETLTTWKDGQPVRLRVWFRGFQPGLAFSFLPWFFDVDD